MNPESHDPASSTSESASPKSTSETLDELSRTLTEAIKKGGREAKRAFEAGVPKVKSDFGQGLYEVAYAVGYAATFGASILREGTPETLRKGFSEGSASGRRAAEEAKRHRQENSETEARTQDSEEGAWA